MPLKSIFDHFKSTNYLRGSGLADMESDNLFLKTSLQNKNDNMMTEGHILCKLNPIPIWLL